MATEFVIIRSVLKGNSFFFTAPFNITTSIDDLKWTNNVTFRYSNTFIAFVTEVSIDQLNTKLLAIGVHCSPTTSCIYLFAVNDSRIIHAIEVDEKLTSCSFIEPQICVDSALYSFNGCIIVGTENGKILIIDLFVESCVRVLNGAEFYNNEPKICKIISSTSYKSFGTKHHDASDSEDISFGVQLEGKKFHKII